MLTRMFYRIFLKSSGNTSRRPSFLTHGDADPHLQKALVSCPSLQERTPCSRSLSSQPYFTRINNNISISSTSEIVSIALLLRRASFLSTASKLFSDQSALQRRTLNLLRRCSLPALHKVLSESELHRVSLCSYKLLSSLPLFCVLGISYTFWSEL